MSEPQIDDTNATLAALTKRLHDLETSTTSRMNVLEAVVNAQQVQIDQLIAEKKANRARTTSAASSNPGIRDTSNRDTKMPRFRQNCRQDGNCRNRMCWFTHSKQRALFGAEAMKGLPEYVKRDGTKKEE